MPRKPRGHSCQLRNHQQNTTLQLYTNPYSTLDATTNCFRQASWSIAPGFASALPRCRTVLQSHHLRGGLSAVAKESRDKRALLPHQRTVNAGCRSWTNQKTLIPHFSPPYLSCLPNFLVVYAIRSGPLSLLRRHKIGRIGSREISACRRTHTTGRHSPRHHQMFGGLVSVSIDTFPTLWHANNIGSTFCLRRWLEMPSLQHSPENGAYALRSRPKKSRSFLAGKLDTVTTYLDIQPIHMDRRGAGPAGHFWCVPKRRSVSAGKPPGLSAPKLRYASPRSDFCSTM